MIKELKRYNELLDILIRTIEKMKVMDPKDSQRQYNHDYYAKNREKILARRRELKNEKKAAKEYQHKYYLEHKDELKQKAKARAARKRRRSQYNHDYYAKNREKILRRKHEYYIASKGVK